MLQSIIDEEGVKMTSSNSKEGDEDNEKDGKNWDQPLIIARPDVEVFSTHLNLHLLMTYMTLR